MENILKIEKDLTTEEYEIICVDGSISIDTETTGLDFKKDKLCTIQLYSKNFMSVIRYDNKTVYPNLIKILQNTQIKKIFHNAVFDVSFLLKNLKIDNVDNIICTRISSKLVNGLEHKNSLKPLLKEYLDIDITKEFQTSDWNAKTLTQGQLDYAMSDVIYLRSLWDKLEIELSEQNLLSLAHRIFNFIPTYVLLQMKNIDNIFIY